MNVNVHIASISPPGRPLIKSESESLPLSSFGYFTADNRTHSTTLVHHHFLHAFEPFGRFLRSGDVMNGRNGSPSRAVIRAVVACKVLSLMLRQCFVTGPTLSFAATVSDCLSIRLTCGYWTADYRQLGQVNAKCYSVADKHPLAYSLPAVQRSVTQSTPRAITLSGCLLLSLRSISIHSFILSQPAPMHQLQVDRGGGRGVMFTLYSSSSP